MAAESAHVDQAGRLVIPEAIRERLGLQPGAEVLMEVKDYKLELWTRDEAIRRIQEKYRRLVPPGCSLVDELIAERRREVQKELED